MTAAARDIVALYPALADVLDVHAGLPAGMAAMDVPAGTTLFTENDPCQGFPLLLGGEVRVSQVSSEGRALELYSVVPGEICLVSAACLFRSDAVSGRGVAVAPTRLVVITRPLFREWLGDARFRDFVLGVFAQRMAELSVLVEAVAFRRVDQRLAAALLGHGAQLSTTHQQLAEKLGTVREIVTRVMRRFEAAGWVEQSRERIRIVDSAALRSLAAGSVTQVTDT